MNKVLLGVLVGAVVAGVAFYLYDEEKFMETFDDLKDKADDVLGTVKDRFNKEGGEMADSM